MMVIRSALSSGSSPARGWAAEGGGASDRAETEAEAEVEAAAEAEAVGLRGSGPSQTRKSDSATSSWLPMALENSGLNLCRRFWGLPSLTDISSAMYDVSGSSRFRWRANSTFSRTTSTATWQVVVGSEW